ncbi:MAG: thioredoxin family protein [Verrucomicrobiae bacterium]|nr:thioredoxin family protein [Verrucomicrobiae bacterium]
MKAVPKYAILFAAIWCTAQLKLAAAQLEWLTDVQQALARAKAERKLVLLNFTGSDWCPWCIRLEREVFSKPEFAAYAKTNLVLVLVDFPRSKQLEKKQAEANKALAQQHGIEGLPTLVVLDSDGKRLGAFGYKPGGPAKVIAELERLRSKAGSAAPVVPPPEQPPAEGNKG